MSDNSELKNNIITAEQMNKFVTVEGGDTLTGPLYGVTPGEDAVKEWQAYKEGNVRFEAEEVNTTNYIISSDNVSKIVNRSDASNGKFLAASTGDTSKNSYFEFSIFFMSFFINNISFCFIYSTKSVSFNFDISLYLSQNFL